LPRRWVRLFFSVGEIGKAGWLGKDAGTGIQLSKSTVAAMTPKPPTTTFEGKQASGLNERTKRCPLLMGATCAFESKKVHHEGHKEHEEKS